MEDFDRLSPLTFGVPHLDGQHEQLLRLVHEMHVACEEERPVAELRRLAAVLTLHTRLHFMDEEMFMDGAGYPGLDAHRRRHAEFTEGLLRLQSELWSTRKEQFAQILNYEMKWIHQHLEQEDDELGRWLKESSMFPGLPGWQESSEFSSIPTT